MDADGNVPSWLGGADPPGLQEHRAPLSAAGSGWDDVVKLTFFVVATDELQTVRAVRDEITPERASDVYGHGLTKRRSVHSSARQASATT
jgi:enamine deaminase RidA (YjgF/YER057c/UK114 family)